MLVVFILTVAACEAGLALAIILMLYYRSGRLDMAAWSELREDSIPAYKDQELDEGLGEVQVARSSLRRVFCQHKIQKKNRIATTF